MSRSPRHRRPLIEALEPRLLFSATADIAVFDDGASDGQYLAQAAAQTDLVSIYMQSDPVMMESQAPDGEPQADLALSENPSITTLVFVDTTVDNYETLVDDIRARADANSVAIVYLDANKDGVDQISDYLTGASGISSIHIISHSVAGNLQLGTQVLNENNINQFEAQLTGWQTALDGDADILLYGCDLAANESGINFLRELSALTGADIAASNDLTGNSHAQADWVLEEKIGIVETESLFAANEPMAWQGVLADIVHLNSGAPTHEQAIPTAGRVMQGVQLLSNQTVDRVQVTLADHGTASTSVIMTIHQSNYNGPVVATSSVSTASLGGTLGTVNFDFSAVTFTAYTIYWIEFRTNDAADNLVGIGYINSNVIASEFVVNTTGDSLRDMSIAIIDVQNRAPTVANAISDQSTNEDALYSYTFPVNTFNDLDADTLTYTATLANGDPLPAWLSFNAGTRTLSGVPDNGDVGTISIRVTANDGNGGTVNDTFDLVINNINDDPFLNIPVPNQNATEDALFTYTFPANTFGDGDLGTVFTYTAELAGGGAVPGWLNFDSATRTFSGTPANGDVGTLSIKLIANDGAGGIAEDTFDIVIANANDAPTVANPIANQTATENALFNFSFAVNTFNDQDVGDSLTYTAQLVGGGALPAWLIFDGATRTFSGTPSNGDVGTISVEVIATDGSAASVSDFFDLEVENVGSSNVIYETSGPAGNTQTLSAGVPLYQSFFHDSVGPTYTVDSIVIQLVKDPAASVQTITVSLISGTYDGVVLASDTISSADIGTTIGWKAFTFAGEALDDNQLYFIKVETSSVDGLVRAGIHNTDVYPNGSFYSSFGVEDTSRDLAFQVASGSNTNPVLVNPIANQNATEDAAYNFQFDANVFNDADMGDVLTYSATMADGSALPGWLSFDPLTRTFSGTPLNGDVGTISIRVTADDSHGGTLASDTFDLTVANTNDAPTVANPVPNQNVTEDQAFNFTFAANTFVDQDVGNTLTYSAQLAGGGALPAWLSFDSVTRTFTGTPLNAHVGSVAIDVIANDGNGGTVTDTFNIVVANTNDAPVVANPIANQDATEDVLYSFQFPLNTFSDPDVGDTLTYSAQLAGGGALPAWLSFDPATRTFSGTPANGDVGNFSVELIASDGNGGSITDYFDIDVANVNDAPTVSIALTDYYANEQTAVNLHGTGITISDVDTNTVTVTIAGPAPHSELTANVGTTGAAISSGNGTASLVITGTLNQVNDFLAGNNGGTLTYRLAGDTPSATATLTITANDGALNGNDTATINITALNDAPANTVPGAQATDEDTALVFSAGNGNPIQVGDVDAGVSDLEVSLSVTNGTLTLAGVAGLVFTTGDGTADGSMVFSGTQAAINAALATLTYNPTPGFSGASVLSITTSDLGNTGTGGALTDSDNVNITVNAINDAPTIVNAIPNQNATEDAAFNFQFALNTFADVDVGDTLTYTAQLAGGGAIPAWLSFDPLTRTFSGTPLNANVGTVSIDVIANDGNGGTVTDTFDIVVANANDAPTTANAIPNQNATEDAAFNFQFALNTFADVDVGDTLTYTAQLAGGGAIPAWLSFDPLTRTFSGTPLNANVGTVSIDVIANDGNGGTVTDTFDIVVANANDAPTIANAIPNQNATEDAAFNFQFALNTFADVDVGDTLTYTAQLAGGGAIPAWLSFDPLTRTFSGTPANGDIGTVSIDVIANDGNGGTVTDTFDIVVSDVNDAPTVANPIPDQAATEDAVFNFQFALNTFADVDVGNTLTYSAQLAGGGAMPAWLSFDPATRTFSGTPLNANVGTVSIDVIANDGNGGTVTDTFSVVVANVNDAPTVANPIPNQSVTENSGFNFTFALNTFNDQDVGDVLTYTAQLAGGGALPAWLSFNAATRTFSGVPTNANIGTLALEVIASDGNGGSVADSFDLIVSAEPANLPPVVQAGVSDQVVAEDSRFAFTIPAAAFNDPEGDALTYSAQFAGGGALPTWLTYDAATRTFSGTPLNADVGVIDVVVTASDGTGSASDTFTITVTNTNDAPVASPDIYDVSAQEDSPFTLSLPGSTFSDEDVGDELSYSARLANGDALPSWLSFNAETLTLSGTPSGADVGMLAIQVIASDGQASAFASVNLTIAAVNDVPVTSGLAPINNLEDATGDTVDLFAAFSDDETPSNQLLYSVVSNTNPGLVSSAVIDPVTGRLQLSYGPNQFGSADLVIRAQDAGGAIVETSLRVNIESVNDVPTTTGIADVKVDAGTAPQQMNLRTTFNDIEDGAQLKYSVMGNSNPAIATNVQIDPATGMMMVAFSSSVGGESVITLRALDADGAWVDTQFNVTVTALDSGIEEPVSPQEPGKVPPTLPPTTPPTEPPAVEVPTTPPTGGGEVPPTLNPGGETDTLSPGTGGAGSPGVITGGGEQIDIGDVNDKSSRDYARVEELLNTNNVPLTVLTASTSLLSLIAPDAGFAPWEAADFDNEVRRLRAQMDDALEEEQDRKAVVAGLTFSVTTGLLVWSLRASSLLLTMMSMLPLWRGLDPLPILDEVNKKKKELEQQRKDREREDKSAKEVGYLFDHAQRKESRS